MSTAAVPRLSKADLKKSMQARIAAVTADLCWTYTTRTMKDIQARVTVAAGTYKEAYLVPHSEAKIRELVKAAAVRSLAQGNGQATGNNPAPQARRSRTRSSSPAVPTPTPAAQRAGMEGADANLFREW